MILIQVVITAELNHSNFLQHLNIKIEQLICYFLAIPLNIKIKLCAHNFSLSLL